MIKGKERDRQCRELLGVGEHADLKEVKRAFRARAAVLHPDLNPGDHAATEAFKKITSAYEHLKSLAQEEQKKQPKKETRLARACARVEPMPDISLEELTLRLEHSDNRHVRIHAVRAIGAVGGKCGVWALIKALDDSDSAVVREAVAALGELNARAAGIPLVQLHKKSGPSLKPAIESTLKKIHSPICVKYLDSSKNLSRHPDSA